MKLLDEKGIGTVWSICKEKFALVGHTHNYAGSGSPGGSANSAIGVVDYNQTGKTIQIGYSGTGITGDQIKYIAGYTDGSGNVNAKIKDVSKDALKAWLGLSSVVSDIGFSLDANTGANTLKVTKADGTVAYKGIFKASKSNDGIMSVEDKVKLDGIASGANNYTLPTASDTTLGGIKVSANANGSSWPICVDDNGLAETKILGLEKHGNAIKSIAFVGNINKFTRYAYNTIDIDCGSGNDKLISLPSEAGTLALTSDIPTKTSQLTNDSTFLTSADKYTLPVASDTTLGGVKTSCPYIPGNNWPIYIDPNNKIYTRISGLGNNKGSIGSVIVYGDNYYTEYSDNRIIVDSQNPNAKTINFPSKSGTLALLSDIPDVSSLCRFNFVNSISECKSDRINFLLRCSDRLINLDPFDTYPDGTILIISVSDNSVPVKHNSGGWFYEGDEVGAGYTAYIYKENLKLITKHAGKVYYYSL